MKASVVIPVRNKAPYLKECLDSVFAQSFRDFEVIAVDDASTDDSLEILRSVDDPRMRVIALERNVGPGGAAQRAMDVANGEIILRTDADDHVLPGRFQKQIALLDREPTIGVTSGHKQLMAAPHILHKVPLEDADCKARLLFGVALNQTATAYRRQVLEQHAIRFQDDWPFYGEDWMQHVALSRVTRFKNLDEPLASYREGPNNVVHGRDRATDLRWLYRYVFKSFGLPITDEQVEMQLWTVKCFSGALVPGDVKRFKGWLEQLSGMNLQADLFDQQALQRQLDAIWSQLFFVLPQFGAAPALAHLRLSRSLDPSRWYYLLASLADRSRARP